MGKTTSSKHYYIYTETGHPMEVNLELYKKNYFEYSNSYFSKKGIEYNLENALFYGVLTFGVLLTLSSILSKKNS